MNKDMGDPSGPGSCADASSPQEAVSPLRTSIPIAVHTPWRVKRGGYGCSDSLAPYHIEDRRGLVVATIIGDVPELTRDADARARLIAAAPDLFAALGAAIGYLLNAKIDLETGCTKATAIKTIEGGIVMARAAMGLAQGIVSREASETHLAARPEGREPGPAKQDVPRPTHRLDHEEERD